MLLRRGRQHPQDLHRFPSAFWCRMSSLTITIAGDQHDCCTTQVFPGDWVCNTETRTGWGTSEADAIGDLYELLYDDVVSVENPAAMSASR